MVTKNDLGTVSTFEKDKYTYTKHGRCCHSMGGHSSALQAPTSAMGCLEIQDSKMMCPNRHDTAYDGHGSAEIRQDIYEPSEQRPIPKTTEDKPGPISYAAEVDWRSKVQTVTLVPDFPLNQDPIIHSTT